MRILRRRGTAPLGGVASAAIAAVVAFAGAPSSAPASFPGVNGLVAGVSGFGTVSTFQMSGDERGTLPYGTSLQPAELDPAWSPDGTQLAFTRYVDGQADIWISDAEGGNARPVITDPADDTDPTWSADGRIAFTSTRGGDAELYVADASGAGLARLTDTAGINQQADWSPIPGGPIAFESTRDGNHELYLIQPDGSGEIRLTADPELDVDASWSPDGTQLAFASGPLGATHISVMSPAAGGPRRLTFGRDVDRLPAWSPDGRKLAFTRGPSVGTLYVMDADGADVHRAGALNGYDVAWAPLRPARDPATGAEPTVAETAFAVPQGAVEIQPTGSNVVTPLPPAGLEIPTGSKLDARGPGATVALVMAASGREPLSRLIASAGKFRLKQASKFRQKQGYTAVTTLRLLGPRCSAADGRSLRVNVGPAPGGAAAGAIAAASRRRGKGKNRVRGAYSIAGSHFTEWTTVDRCFSTTTIVHSGVVSVHDLVTGKDVELRAGDTYVARKAR